MAKSGEKTYFKKIGEEGMAFTLAKPFSDPGNVGGLLSDIAAVFSFLPQPPAKLIDLGCGSGWTSNFYAQAGYDVTGVDIAPDAVKAAKKRFTKPELKLAFVCADYDNLKYNDKFDAAVFFDALHHAEDEVDALRAAYKTLKPGGQIILCEPGVGHSKSPSSIEAMEKYGVNERDMPPKLSKKALKQAGFTNITVYAYPAITHRALYKSWVGPKAVRNGSVARAAVATLLSTFMRRNHGIVVATKPAE